MLTWHKDQWQTLLGNGPDRIGHATLLIGGQGLGQRQFANELAALLLCEQPVMKSLPGIASSSLSAACGACPSCHWLSTDTHPDFRCIQPEDADDSDDTGGETKAPVAGKTKKASSTIKIDAIRALEDFVFVGSHRHGRRVIIIDPAEAMNVNAANALLKILEEPPSSVYFLILSYKSRALLPTLRSRCRSLVFRRPPRSQAEEWLRGAGADTRATRFLDVVNGAPATVLEWQDAKLLPAMEVLIASFSSLLKSPAPDPLALAAQWDALLKKESTLSLDLLVEAIQRWLFDLATNQATGVSHYYSAWPHAAIAPKASLGNLVRGWREILRFRRSARHPLNQLLFLEDFATQTVRSISASAKN